MKKIANFDDLNPAFILCPLQRVQFKMIEKGTCDVPFVYGRDATSFSMASML